MNTQGEQQQNTDKWVNDSRILHTTRAKNTLGGRKNK